MKFATLFLSLSTLAVGIASAATSYNLTLHTPATVAGKELKPGNYKVQVEGSSATIKGDGGSVQAQVTPTQNASKYSSTTVQYHVANGKNRVEEIRLGGTSTKLIFSGTGEATGN